MINIEKKPILISSSVSCMDLCNLKNSINEVEKAGVSFLSGNAGTGKNVWSQYRESKDPWAMYR